MRCSPLRWGSLRGVWGDHSPPQKGFISDSPPPARHHSPLVETSQVPVPNFGSPGCVPSWLPLGCPPGWKGRRNGVVGPTGSVRQAAGRGRLGGGGKITLKKKQGDTAKTKRTNQFTVFFFCETPHEHTRELNLFPAPDQIDRVTKGERLDGDKRSGMTPRGSRRIDQSNEPLIFFSFGGSFQNRPKVQPTIPAPPKCLLGLVVSSSGWMGL